MARKWKVVEAWDGCTIEDQDGNQVIEQSGPYGTPCIAKSDADLMAAAPELLEAVKMLLIGAAACAIPHPKEREVLQMAVDFAIKAKNKAKGVRDE